MKLERRAFRQRLRRIRALVLDVDGILTDGASYWSERGEAMKRFNMLDGKGVELLRDAGIEVGIITGEDTKIVRRHIKALGIKHAFIGEQNKLDALERFAKKHNLDLGSIAYAGDDLIDIPCLKRAGLGLSVPNADIRVRRVAHYITQRRGGDGAAREMADLILSERKERAPANH